MFCVTVLMLSLATAPAHRACSPATPDDFFFKFILVAFCVTRLHLVTGLIGKCCYVFVGGGGLSLSINLVIVSYSSPRFIV